MARPLRLEIPGGVYHITSRGNRRAPIYLGDGDRSAFLEILSEVVSRFGWLCHAYCLMGNHYHLLIETPDGELSRGMRHLNGVYTQRFNANHRKVGHLFQGRYKAVIVQKDSHLLEVTRYVVLNPVRARMVKTPYQWRWSSYRATIASETCPDWLTTDWVLRQFARRRSAAVAGYKKFVHAGIGLSQKHIWRDLTGGLVYGDESFVRDIGSLVDGKEEQLKEIPRSQRLVARPTLEELFVGIGRDKRKRNNAIAAAYLEHRYPMTEISRHLGIHYSTVCRAVKEKEMNKCKT